MNTKNIPSSAFGQTLHSCACGAALAVGLIVLVLVLHAAATRAWTVKNIQSWCIQAGACSSMPEYFGNTQFGVFSDKAAEAQTVVERYAIKPLSSLVAVPLPSITVIPRSVVPKPSIPKGSSAKAKVAL